LKNCTKKYTTENSKNIAKNSTIFKSNFVSKKTFFITILNF
jgi:hypothetical protein